MSVHIEISHLSESEKSWQIWAPFETLVRLLAYFPHNLKNEGSNMGLFLQWFPKRATTGSSKKWKVLKRTLFFLSVKNIFITFFHYKAPFAQMKSCKGLHETISANKEEKHLRSQKNCTFLLTSLFSKSFLGYSAWWSVSHDSIHQAGQLFRVKTTPQIILPAWVTSSVKKPAAQETSHIYHYEGLTKAAVGKRSTLSLLKGFVN